MTHVGGGDNGVTTRHNIRGKSEIDQDSNNERYYGNSARARGLMVSSSKECGKYVRCDVTAAGGDDDEPLKEGMHVVQR